MGRLRGRIGFLWSGIHPDGIELLSAALSITFGILLLYRGATANALGGMPWLAVMCFASGTLKITGVILELLLLRVLGLLLGTVFWVACSYVFLRAVPGSITWLCFAVLALAQLWAVRRLVIR